MRYLLILILVFISSISYANKTNKYFLEGKKLFITNNFKEEKILKTVLLLDPKNEEGLFLLSKMYLREGDFKLADKEFNLLKKVCNNFCSKLENLELEILKSKK